LSEEKRPFTKEQPHYGESILHCGHPNSRPQHFYSFGPGMPEKDWKSPDGRVVTSRWMVLCDDCNKIYGFTPHLAMQADATWKALDPVIQVPEVRKNKI